MANVVSFWTNNKANYNAITTKDNSTVYFCKDTGEIFKGTESFSKAVRIVDIMPTNMAYNILYIIKTGENAGGWVLPYGETTPQRVLSSLAVSTNGISVADLPIATSTSSGLMSAEDKAKLDTAVTDIAGIKTAYPVTISSSTGADSSTTYTFTQNGNSIGTINIQQSANNSGILSGEVRTIEADTVMQGDSYLPAGKYLVLTINNTEQSKVYISFADIASTEYEAGEAIKITNGRIGLKAVPANGLRINSDNALQMDLATTTTAGAMSAEDKAKLDSIQNVVTSVDTSNGLTLSNGLLSFDPSGLSIESDDITVNDIDGNSTTLNSTLTAIYNSLVWEEN